MPFKPVSSKTDFPQLERDILQWWKESDSFNKLRKLRAGNKKWSFVDGPITANNPMGVHHAWGRTYKDVFQRYKAMQGFDERWQNGFDCQGLWVEVNVEKDLGFKSKRDIEEYGLAPFVILCKQRVLNYSAVQTEQSIRLGYWMDWNDTDTLRMLSEKLGENPNQTLTVQGPKGPVTGTVEQIVGQLGLPQLGGSYFTFSDENNYQIWGFIKKCADNGWLYKGTDVMPWCARCGTGVSEHEISTEDYPDLTHPSITARFPLRGRTNEYLLVWTTTPWTLTSNVAVAVGPELTYLKIRQNGSIYYLTKGTTKMLTGAHEILGELKGTEMEGWTYDGPFDELPAQQTVGGYAPAELRNHIGNAPTNSAQAHRVILWKDVGDAEGTGLVHIAPGCGAEDFHLGKEFNLPVVAPIDENGVFIENFGEFSGMSAFDVAPRVIESLQHKGYLYRSDDYTHRYPTCWRCKTELLFRLVDEWFISMGQTYDKPREQLTPEEKARSLRYQIMDVVDQIKWVPQFGHDREMDWLRLMHDWMISKKRYWGLALPIWECPHGHVTVVGSREELEERAVEGWDKFSGHTPHRPFIDDVKIKCEKCGEKTSRIKDVGNPWLDAGIVTMSTMGFRTDRAFWEKWYPADFITESFPGQFRNWFYSVLAMGTAMTGRPPFKTLMGYGTLFAEDGRPMHKSLGNMIEFNEAADEIGADVMRWMFSRTRYESNMLFGYHVADETRRMFLLPLWNVYSFFVTYANLDKWTPDRRPPTADRNQLDKWILARLQQLIAEMTPALDEYDAPTAARAVEPFIDDLSNWYLRRSRRRFWKSEDDDDKHAAYATLYEVLVTLTQLLAPFMPFTAESMYQNLVRSVDPNAPESVHHCEWPQVDESKLDQQLLTDMAVTRQVVNLGHSIRAAKGLKIRQPLGRAVIVADAAQHAGITHLADLATDELNVKKFEFAMREEELVSYQLRPNFQTLSPKVQEMIPDPETDDKALKKEAREKRKAVMAGLQTTLSAQDASQVAATVRAGKSVTLTVNGFKIELAPADVLITPQPKPGFAVQSEGNLVVALDTTITPELAAEGLAREMVRRVQDLRKSAGFDVADHIKLYYTATPKLASAIQTWREYITTETLADEMHATVAPTEAATVDDSFDGEKVTVSLVKKWLSL
ncbi:MAG: isoleucine--tRNA ligase [Chloroflexi bacterium]|nr:isoleucine--tRNA ligase [Chloroflexota bacterium]